MYWWTIVESALLGMVVGGSTSLLAYVAGGWIGEWRSKTPPRPYRLRIFDENGHEIESFKLDSPGVHKLVDAFGRGQFR